MTKLQSPARPTPTENRAIRRYGKISEAAEVLGVTTRTIRQMIADGRLIGYRSGSRLVRVDLNQIDDIMRPFGGAA
ncbi:excisionase family DNA-binding protein [Mycobacterium marinum]|uniref:excisionase family DNA-binding protein n=1 Tax=Mycobacterium marinum TaxID=1781 RepID=UPI000E3B7372|nr:excisionase family DNA-binding protein [Mycobacterium marinum]RFZ08111.1 Helix-turn-helix domain protein [Mycobacterium marinum]WCS20140.1 excisionase family DNA-binding protein [Mycobacterium marinum]